MKKIVVLLICMVVVFFAKAQKAYLYIEPIKGIPCKLLINEKEQVALTKSYFLFTLNTNQEAKVDIVFGNKAFPAQTFVIDVIEGCSYGFKLAKTAEDKFYLLDLVNNGKIVETNTATNIALTTNENKINFFDSDAIAAMTAKEEASKKTTTLKSFFTKKEKEEKVNNVVKEDVKNEPETKKEYGVVEVFTSNQPAKEVVKAKATSNEPSAKCAIITSEQEIQSFVEKLSEKNDDESKLILTKKRAFTGCITIAQTNEIVKQFNTQYGRFSAVKFLRPLFSDPDKIFLLESLFKSDSYKDKLKAL